MIETSSSIDQESEEPGTDEALDSAVSTELEQTLGAVESRLDALGQALCSLDLPAVDLHGFELRRELLHAVQCFAQAACHRVLPTRLRQRMTNATGKVAAQREALARATQALDRAIDVLIQFEAPQVGLQTPVAAIDLLKDEKA